VRWSEVRYKNIFDQLFPFLTDIGFMPHKITFVPVSASTGENLTKQTNELLRAWYDGPTLVEELGEYQTPALVRDAS
jgi:elongation factor 1 alpha-like protein